jgi:hypothetical protein
MVSKQIQVVQQNKRMGAKQKNDIKFYQTKIITTLSQCDFEKNKNNNIEAL